MNILKLNNSNDPLKNENIESGLPKGKNYKVSYKLA